jgi:transcriptional regulator with XRE-family HTH domain
MRISSIQEGTRPVQPFGDTLRQRRTEAGLTQGDLAKRANWSQSQISRTEQNLFTPDHATVERLDRALDAHGQLLTAYATASAPISELLHPGSDPLVFSDLMRKIHRTDVGRDTSVPCAPACSFSGCDGVNSGHSCHLLATYVQITQSLLVNSHAAC